ncbi:hypothetical protein GQF61_11730 [Sphingobacterium sp. DK4209]|uniref:TolC family protein n=1 Tax=Sphingobacterium zhuxiongii TaxID=2662364 RepID=A0A5Q0QDA5_9SPHI|nr:MULTISPECIES: TolC family protein [unclassified Sphingobacterium]MVZ66531.1 hypothetical protein [Sphingobacterium sp. DK4209]QGA27815.1 hypothetical protein GFH32_16460 [Sphingobacterium sp. dk4302]
MRKILFYMCCLMPVLGYTQSLSVEQLWAEMTKGNAYQQKQIEKSIKNEDLQELRSNRIPVFYLDANLQRNLIIPTTPVPAIAFDPTAADGAIIPLKFATKWSSKVGVQMEWDLFDPKRGIQEQQKRLDIDRASINLEKQVQEWKIDATLAYAAVVLATEQYALAVEDSISYQKILTIVKKRYDEGREGGTEYVQAQQELERRRINLYEAWSVLVDSDLELRRFVNLDSTKVLSSNMNDIGSFAHALRVNNYELETLQLDQQMNELQQRELKKGLLPTVKVNAYLGEQFYSNEFRLDRGADWFGNSFINLALRIPLSTYLSIQPSLRKSALKQQLTELQLVEEQYDDQIRGRQKAVKIEAAVKKLASYQAIEKLSIENKSIKEKEFEAGRILLVELLQSHAAFQQAKRERWQASYDLLKISLKTE